MINIGRIWKKKRLKSREFEYLLEEYRGDEIVALDTETTGLNPKKDEILTIGAVKIRGNKILLSKTFEESIRPKGEIDRDSIKIHLIRECDLKDAKDAEEVILGLLRFIGNRPLVGYYIGFDKKIVSRYTKEFIGVDLQNRTIELSDMYYKRYRKHSAYEFVDLRFDVIMEKLGIPSLGRHDALNDAIMSALIYLKLKDIPEYKGAFA